MSDGRDGANREPIVNGIAHSVHPKGTSGVKTECPTDISGLTRLKHSMTQKKLANLNGSGAAYSLYSSCGKRKYINTEERERFLNAAAESDTPTNTLCMTLAFTGCRLSEALELTTASIQPPGNIISIRSLKKRRSRIIREVPVPDRLIVALDQAYRLSSTNPQDETTPNDRHLWTWRRTWAWMRIKTIMNKAGIVGAQATPKGLRHGFGVQAIRSGVPLNLLQKWLGHAQMSTTAIYADVAGPEELAIARRMWE